MGLDDVYYKQPWTPNQNMGAQMDRGFAAWPTIQEQAANRAAVYNDPSREANPFEKSIVHNIMKATPGYQPEHADRFFKEWAASQNGLAGGQGGPPSTPNPQDGDGGPPPSPGLAGPLAGPNASMVNLGQQPQWQPDLNRGLNTTQEAGMPQVSVSREPMSMNGEPMRKPLPAARSFAMDRNPPPPSQSVPSIRLVQSQPDAQPMTRGDVDLAMKMGPIMKAMQTPRDYMAEIEARGRNAQELERLRQTGRIQIRDIVGAQRTLELAARLSMNQKQLDEKTANDLNQIHLGYARIQAMYDLMDKNIDFKKTQGADQVLKSATQAVDSMMNARSNLIGSAFASTPEGQHALAMMDEVVNKTLPVLQSRMENDQGPPANQGTTTETHVTQGQNATRGPAGAQPPSGPQAPPKIDNTKYNRPGSNVPGQKFKVGDQFRHPQKGMVEVTGVDAQGRITSYRSIGG